MTTTNHHRAADAAILRRRLRGLDAPTRNSGTPSRFSPHATGQDGGAQGFPLSPARPSSATPEDRLMIGLGILASTCIAVLIGVMLGLSV